MGQTDKQITALLYLPPTKDKHTKNQSHVWSPLITHGVEKESAYSYGSGPAMTHHMVTYLTYCRGNNDVVSARWQPI